MQVSEKKINLKIFDDTNLSLDEKHKWLNNLIDAEEGRILMKYLLEEEQMNLEKFIEK